jgi:hypothetical protein
MVLRKREVPHVQEAISGAEPRLSEGQTAQVTGLPSDGCNGYLGCRRVVASAAIVFAPGIVAGLFAAFACPASLRSGMLP